MSDVTPSVRALLEQNMQHIEDLTARLRTAERERDELRADVAALREALSDLLNYTRKVEGLAAVTLARYSRLPEEGATELGDRCRAILDRPHPGEDMVLVSRERLEALEAVARSAWIFAPDVPVWGEPRFRYLRRDLDALSALEGER